MAEIVFLLSGLMSVACSIALFRGFRKTSNRLLLWSCLSFSLLAVTNVFLCVDLVILPDVELYGALIRNLLTALSGSLLLGGLIWELT